ncbi:MAG: hypothetical protein K2G20_06300 [Lachnospiraceae bacterium]|nr:hypothetical protein [Lachnospiraceae bacterium]
MKSSKKKKTKQPMSKTKKVVLSLVGIAAAVGIFYLAYYFIHYMWYGGYKKYLGSYEYEQGGVFTPVPEAKSDVPGYELVCENEFLKLYTDTKTANIAVYDKRDGSITYSNPQNPEEDSIANAANINYLKSQLVVQYYNADVRSSNYDSYSQSVAKGQYSTEGIANGIRYIYQIGDIAGAYVEVPLEYRLEQDKLVVSIPASGIVEYGDCYLYRIQLLRYMGAAHSSEDGYMVVPNGSGSLIYFNNGKTSADNYTQYIYDIDPMVSTYTTLENVSSAKLPVFGICRTDRSMLVTVEDGATTALITASVSGSYNDYNYVYPTFVLRNIDNLRMFGNSTTDVYVMEPNLYDINMQVSYAFPGEDYQGYAGLANYYRERLIAEGVLTPDKTGGDIPFYYDVIAGVKETAHFLGTQYLHTFSMTSFGQAKEMAEALSQDGITNQVMNLQGWFNGGYYHNAPHNIKVPLKLGGKSGLEKLEDAINGLGGRLYVDVAFQRVTFADDGFNYNAESSRYYGSGYVAAFGQVNPTTLRNTSGLDYYETRYDLLSPKFLPRYVSKFVKKIKKYDVGGISLRDLGNVLTSDKKRTEIINREEALDVVLGQFELLKGTGKRLMTSEANAYSFAYSTDIINVPITDNSYAIVDESIPFYEMVIHGCISYSTELLNYEDAEDMTGVVLQMIEAGASPHYVFTWKDSSEMKNTGLNRYYATTFDIWKGEAVEIYNRVNEALKHVSGAMIVNHEILDGGVRKVTYDNGVIIYINYGSETQKVDGMEIPAMSYRMEGI